jgi:hypothetical protein
MLFAMLAGVLGGFVANATPAKAAVNGFMTCKINLLSDGSDSGTPSTRIIECYY